MALKQVRLRLGYHYGKELAQKKAKRRDLLRVPRLGTNYRGTNALEQNTLQTPPWPSSEARMS